MKTKNLVKVLLLLMSVVAMSVAIVGCGDDDKPDTPEMKASIVGKWHWEKTIDSEGEDVNDGEECKSKKGYIEFSKNGSYTEINYNEECEISYKTIGKWQFSDKMLTINATTIVAYDNEDIGVELKYVLKILEVNKDSLVFKLEQRFYNGKEDEHYSPVVYFSRMQ